MNSPSRLHAFIHDSNYSIVVSCLAYVLCSLFLFASTGLRTAQAEALGFDSQGHLLGLILLMTLLPVWLIVCMFVTQRHSLLIARKLDADLAAKVATVPFRHIVIGFAAGILYALAFNVPITQFSLVLEGNGPIISIFIGQMMVWAFVGWMLAVRLYVGTQFYRFGKLVPVNVFEQTPLQPFARVGLLDVAIVVGGLAVSTVQSIDAQFRLENYLTAFIVAIPAAAALLVRPMWSVHQRLRDQKQTLMHEVVLRIRETPQSTDLETLVALETLLSRRDRISALQTWPLDFAIWSRLFFYGLIPPLAWVGAAVVELIVERVVGI